VFRHPDDIEKPGGHDLTGVSLRLIGQDQRCHGVGRRDDGAGTIAAGGSGSGDLVQDHVRGKFDLVGQQVRKGARCDTLATHFTSPTQPPPSSSGQVD